MPPPPFIPQEKENDVMEDIKKNIIKLNVGSEFDNNNDDDDDDDDDDDNDNPVPPLISRIMKKDDIEPIFYDSTKRIVNDFVWPLISPVFKDKENEPIITSEHIVDSEDAESFTKIFDSMVKQDLPLSPFASMMFHAPMLKSAHMSKRTNKKPGNECPCQHSINFGGQCVHKLYAEKDIEKDIDLNEYELCD